MENNKENKENLVMEAKLEGGIDPKGLASINEKQAIAEIAKSLIQDFTFTITMQIISIVLSNVKNADKVLDAIKQVWKKRASAQLVDEQQRYQEAITEAFGNEKNISEETSKKIEQYMKAYCDIRDKAVVIADGAVDDIIKSVLQKPQEKKDEVSK